MISIHALLAESDEQAQSLKISAHRISIHALLAESDSAASITPAASRNFYPRSPCGERLDERCKFNRDNRFLSTLSLRRATQTKQTCRAETSISIHALLAESDINTYHRIFGGGISIHALLAESDCLSICRQAPAFYFYPRSPCGERRYPAILGRGEVVFLSTLSLRRAT